MGGHGLFGTERMVAQSCEEARRAKCGATVTVTGKWQLAMLDSSAMLVSCGDRIVWLVGLTC